MIGRRIDFSVAVDALRRGFWFLPLVAMVLGGTLGFVMPMLDTAVDGKVGMFTTSDRDSARGLLETIAIATLSVAGIAFSVTVVALQLASQQLGPRVLRTFQADRLSQATLAAFLGLFVYSLISLGRLATVTLADGEAGPNLVLTVGVLGAVLALCLFAVFIQNTVVSVQASKVIERIVADADAVISCPFPDGFGAPGSTGGRWGDQDAGNHSSDEVAVAVTARRSGYLNAISVDALIETASECDAVCLQRVPIGDYVIGGMQIAEIRAGSGVGGAVEVRAMEEMAEKISAMIEIGADRTLVQDVAFPVRQLADVALRALSPSLNDPTTAENAMGALTHVLAEFAHRDPASLARADQDGAIRFVAIAPDLDGLVRLGFDQVREQTEGQQPAFRSAMVSMLSELRRVAVEQGDQVVEIDRQRGMIEQAALRSAV